MSVLFSCTFKDKEKITLIKGVLFEEMYEDGLDGTRIKDSSVGKILEELLSKSRGLLLFQKLRELSHKHNCVIKIDKPILGLAGLQKHVQQEGSKNIWVLNYSVKPMERIIAINRPQGGFEFCKIQVPPCVVLAHELLHYLFRLENYGNGVSGGRFVEKVFLNSLAEKISCEKMVLLFGDTKQAKKQAYDELTAIVGYSYKVDGADVFLGETAFLQEYLGTGNCFLCYGHSTKLNSSLLTSEVARAIVDLEDVKGKIAVVNATADDLEKILSKSERGGRGEFIEITVKADENLSRETGKGQYLCKATTSVGGLSRAGIVTGSASTVPPVSFPVAGTPPFSTENQETIPFQLETQLAAAGYRLQDVPADGNCAFTAVMAYGNEKFRKFETKLNKEQLTIVKELRKAVADEMQRAEVDRPDFIEMLRQPGFWNNGIDGSVGIEVLSFVARHMGRPILVLTLEPGGCYRYWVSGTTANPWDGNLEFHDVEGKNLGELLNDHPETVKLFHNGIHFQAIVRDDSPAGSIFEGTPSQPKSSPAVLEKEYKDS